MEQKLDEISKKLSVLIALLAKSVPDFIDNKEMIKMLDRYGLSNNEVAAILGMKPSAVSMARLRMKEKNDKAEN